MSKEYTEIYIRNILIPHTNVRAHRGARIDRDNDAAIEQEGQSRRAVLELDLWGYLALVLVVRLLAHQPEAELRAWGHAEARILCGLVDGGHDALIALVPVEAIEAHTLHCEHRTVCVIV